MAGGSQITEHKDQYTKQIKTNTVFFYENKQRSDKLKWNNWNYSVELVIFDDVLSCIFNGGEYIAFCFDCAPPACFYQT